MVLTLELDTGRSLPSEPPPLPLPFVTAVLDTAFIASASFPPLHSWAGPLKLTPPGSLI